LLDEDRVHTHPLELRLFILTLPERDEIVPPTFRPPLVAPHR
jgi:hypothetical protein